MKTETLEFKQRVLDAAREKQQSVIDAFRGRINDLKESAMEDRDGQYDSDELASSATTKDLLDKVAGELNYAVEEMNELNRMKVGNEPHKSVAIGSVVETDRATFFPSVSVERFAVDGRDILGLSVKAPLFLAMRGKKSGEQFTYRDTVYTIKDVY